MANSKRRNCRYGIHYIITVCIRMVKQIIGGQMFGYKLVKETPLIVNSEDKLLKELIQMMEETSKELSVHIETLRKVGIVQKSITERLDHIESFLDRLYGTGEEEEENRTIN